MLHLEGSNIVDADAIVVQTRLAVTILLIGQPHERTTALDPVVVADEGLVLLCVLDAELLTCFREVFENLLRLASAVEVASKLASEALGSTTFSASQMPWS